MKNCANQAECANYPHVKVNGKHTIVPIVIVQIKQNVRIIQGSHYPDSTGLTLQMFIGSVTTALLHITASLQVKEERKMWVMIPVMALAR